MYTLYQVQQKAKLIYGKGQGRDCLWEGQVVSDWEGVSGTLTISSSLMQALVMQVCSLFDDLSACNVNIFHFSFLYNI